MMKGRNRIGKYLKAAGVASLAVLFLNFLPASQAVVAESKAPILLTDATGVSSAATALSATAAASTTAALSVRASATTALSATRSAAATASHDGAFELADSAHLRSLYETLRLDSLGLSSQAWVKAINGFLNMMTLGTIRNSGVLSIIDFSQPSNQKRLFILDTYNGKLLFNTLVAHGKNSGTLLATKFSNRRNSFMSSLGFYVTGDPFVGQHGYSLRLEGVEKGWNDNVYNRAIIMHSADYVSDEHISRWGYLGRSEGCPAIPQEFDRPIIDSIRGGSCLFVYGENSRYARRSSVNDETEVADDYTGSGKASHHRHNRRHRKTGNA